MRYIIYKVTNLINGKYYIGRHATKDINDSYMGSGLGIINAINKYGKENFKKEIIAEANDAEELWELEKEIVDNSIVEDKMSYNMAYGGRNYIDGLRKHNPEKFSEHQSRAGKSGAKKFLESMSTEQRKEWHSKGGKSASNKNKINGTHPFITGEAAVLGGKAMNGLIELWNPNSKATNKNQSTYKPGDCKRVKEGSPKYLQYIELGWKPINQHKESCKAW